MRKKKSPPINASDIVMGLRLLAEREFVNHDFTRKESQVAHRLLRGESGDHIAKKLYITTSCVRYHITNIYEKTRSHNKQEFIEKIWRGINTSKTTWKNTNELHDDKKQLAETVQAF